MKAFYIMYMYKGSKKEAFINALTSNKAIDKLMSSIRERNKPVKLKILKIEVLKLII